MSCVTSSPASLEGSDSPPSACTSCISSADSTPLITPAEDVLRTLDSAVICEGSEADCDGDEGEASASHLKSAFGEAIRTPTRGLALPKTRVKSMVTSRCSVEHHPSMVPRMDISAATFGKSRRFYSMPDLSARPHFPKQASLASGSCSSITNTDGIIPGDNTPISPNFPCSFGGPTLQIDEPVANVLIEQPLLMGFGGSKPTPELPPLLDSSPRPSVGVKTLKNLDTIFCYLPSIMATGCALLLFPHHIDFLLFQTGYLSARNGAERLAALASIFGVVPIFLFTVVWLAGFYFRPASGLAFACAVLFRFMYVWWDFQFTQDIPLGEDDRQSICRILVKHDLGITDETIARQPSGSVSKMKSFTVG
ncbi:hypothetical protein FIBSPDRAFT_954464 [Athelia psychrophila]|uniref:Uncharacterized protein n=1 Tax=Athelia psychrophila TaxID=1759441 RepID=A0A166J5L7_9AGAM|nr:hypothetical protein FIBSPDRAFT_954464 [Fibularhizoctonia sp. CBS 109695]